MKRIVILLLVLTVVAGCVHRINIYSPRRPNTEAHRNARSTSDCLGCHEVKGIEYHSEKDDCFRCHLICWEY